MSFPDDLWISRFPVPPHIAAFGTEEEQFDARLRARIFGMMAHLARHLATRQEIPLKCALKACHRARACVGQRLPVNWDDRVMAITPPCLPAAPDHPYTQTLQRQIGALHDRVAEHGWSAVMRRERAAQRTRKPPRSGSSASTMKRASPL